MSDKNEQNAVISSFSLGIERGLSMWLNLDYGSSGQGFGGYLLHNTSVLKEDRETQGNYAGHFICRCLEIAGVEDIKDLPGKTIRVRGGGLGGYIEAIGHIISDDWFYPEREMELIRADR